MAITQAAYRIYADGTESGSSALASQDTSATVAVSGGPVVLGVRIGVTKSSGGIVSPITWQLQYRLNGGSWVNVGSTGQIAYYNSSNLTDEASTTQRLTGMSGSFVAGRVCEDAFIDDHDISGLGGKNTEYLFSVISNLGRAASVEFRLLRDGTTLDAYTVYPSVNVNPGTPSLEPHGLLLLGVGGG